MTLSTWVLLFALQLQLWHKQPVLEEKPNVIFILIDDVGIGDLECQGNPWIKTPNINQLYSTSARLTDFHVSPLCTPTRSALMTGQYPINNGAWATYKGRAALSKESITIAQIFKENGYATGMFGKWHLGNNYPSRPTDKGFDFATHHSFGGISELTDYWGNDYFDDVYLKDNTPKQFEGFCTDVWFDETIDFIKNQKGKPFFVYLPTNAAHAPLNVAEKYTAPYKNLEGKAIPNAAFYGLITNVDENVGRLTAYLKENGLDKNTIVIFATDNGTAFGYREEQKLGYNKGYRGRKADYEEGGHRVPFYIKWPNSSLPKGRDIEVLSSHIDLFPTLVSLCKLTPKKGLDLDGIDLSPYLFGKKKSNSGRTVFVHNRQDWRIPEPINKTCIMRGNWRLINGKELYDIEADKGQKNELSAQYPTIVKSLLKANETFIETTKKKKTYQEFPYESIGSLQQKEIKLTIQNAIGDDQAIYAQAEVAKGLKNQNNKYAIEVEQKGKYRIVCKRWPKEYDGTIKGLPFKKNQTPFNYQSIAPEKVGIKIFGKSYEKAIGDTDTSVFFELDLEKGKTFLEASFIEKSTSYGVFYVYIESLI